MTTNYNITAFSIEERDAIIKKIEENYNVSNLKYKTKIMDGWYVEFNTDKKTWKQIKKDLNLEFSSVFAVRKVVL